MLPLFGDSPAGRRRTRAINLGGNSSSTSHSSILDSAKARREERALQKKRSDSAANIQAAWRSYAERARLRDDLRNRLVQLSSSGLNSEDQLLELLRAVVLVGDEQFLAQLSTAIDQAQLVNLLSQSASFLVLLQQFSLKSIRLVSHNPQSTHSQVLLKTVLGLATASEAITSYLVAHSLYQLVASIIFRTPVASAKTAPALPPLISLAVQPFTRPALVESALLDAFQHVLPIPLLLNRLPIPSLTTLSGKLPFQSMNTIELPYLAFLESHSLEPAQELHVLANLASFVSPRLSKLPEGSFRAYLHFSTQIINALPYGSLEPAPKVAKAPVGDHAHPSDSEEEGSPAQGITVRVVESFNTTPPPPPPTLDPKTYKRLSTLLESSSITVLLHTAGTESSRRALYSYLVVLLSTIATNVRRENLITAILVASGPGLIRELWRVYVRPSALGKEGSSVTRPQVRGVLLPTLLLCDLYAQSLLTMGDDEFFGRSEMGGETGSRTLGDSGSSKGKLPSGPSGSTRARNPLTTDDIQTLTKQLVNVVWELYLREDLVPTATPSASSTRSASSGMDVDHTPSSVAADVESQLRLSWEQIREKVTKLLTGVWARDSRKPFLPKDHWLVPLSQADVGAFIDAALAEDESISAAPPPSENYWEHHRKRVNVLSKRQLAMLSPRLGVLNNVPFVLPFEVRVEIFRHFIAADKMRLGNSRYTYEGRRRMHRAVVRRGKVAQDGFDRLGDADLKAPIEITFIDQFGNEEAGIDGGGVFKEFFTELCKEVFDTDRGLWLANTKNELYPNPLSFATESHSLNWYRFIGRILGKAMYEGILVDVAFAGFFLAKWLGRASFLDDLASLDPQLYNGLVFLKHYDGNLEDLALNFTIAIEELGATRTVDLIPNGSNTPVTKENRLQYIHLISHYRLTKQIKKQSEAFFDGLSEIIDPKWLRMFNQQEVQILIGGVNAPIDIDDLRNNAQYGGLYDDKHETIIAFWNVVDSFDQEKRRQLLRFVTSCSRPPLLGFKELQPNFAIRDAGSDEDRLPTASTCVNLLKLPRYTSERLLRTKLSQAIAAGAGFDLS